MDGFVLEDDYDAEFRYDRNPVGCLQGLCPRRVVLLGSVSASLSPRAAAAGVYRAAGAGRRCAARPP